MGIDGKMDVKFDVSNVGYAGRLEVLEGRTGRRVCPATERARIAAESLMPGTKVADVARKYGVARWQVYDWRRRLQRGQLTLPESMAPMFAPLTVEESSVPECLAAKPSPAQVEIAIGEVIIRTSVQVEQLSAVIRAVRSSR
jgi:transposase